MRVPIGFFRAKRGRKTLERYQDLVRHDWQWAIDLRTAKPLEELISDLPPDLPPYEQRRFIKRDLARLNPIVYQLLSDAAVATRYSWERFELDWNSEQIPRPHRMIRHEIDVVANYENLERGTSDATQYDALMRTLERGIGVYADAQRSAAWDFINPIAWIAWVIRLPLDILTRSGLKTDETTGKLAGVYINVIRTLILLALAFLAAKLGISAVEALKAFFAVK